MYFSKIKSNTFIIVDARCEGRFNGTEQEPRAHLKSGNIPNSVNIPFKEALKNGKFKSSSELKQIYTRWILDGMGRKTRINGLKNLN